MAPNKPSNFFMAVDGNPRNTWEAIRTDIGLRVFGRNVTTVPVLDESNFNLFTVYKKEPPSGLMARCRSPTFHILGRLEDFLDLSRTNLLRISTMRSRARPSRFRKVYEFLCHDVYEDVVKEVTVRMYEMRCQTSTLLKQRSGDIILNTEKEELQNVKRVFIISELFYCKRLYLFVRLGDREIIANLSGEPVPIAFRSDEFKVRPDGSIVFKGKAKARLTSNDAQWVLRTGETVVPPLPMKQERFRLGRVRPKEGGFKEAQTLREALHAPAIFPRINSPQTNDPDSDLSRDHDRRGAIQRQF